MRTMPVAQPQTPNSPRSPAVPGQRRWAQLAASLRERVVAGAWPAGSAPPSEQALAAEHSVALGTLRQAMAVLVQEGLIERRHGHGTFVRGSLSAAPMLRFFRFGGSAAGAGEAPASRILSRQQTKATAEAARVLGIPRGAAVLRLKRLRAVAGEPRLLEDIWLPLPRFAALSAGEPGDWGALLYPAFAERCGVVVHRVVDSVAFGLLGAGDARPLLLAAGHPCATVTRQAFDLAGDCVEYRITRGDAFAFHYTVQIT